MVRILGISACRHDSAAALVEDGRIVAAAQEERFSRRKHDNGFPRQAAAYCLDMAGGGDAGPDHLACLGAVPAELPGSWPESWRAKAVAVEAHLAHAASAFFPSPFADAAILTLDGGRDRVASTFALGRGSRIEILREFPAPQSLGLLYAALTAYLGFRAGGEYKVMGLAAYGSPRYAGLMRDRLVSLAEDGGFLLNDACLDTGSLAELFGRPARRPDLDPLEPFHLDVAASLQTLTEENILRLAGWLRRLTGAANLCLAGGVALNCVANGRLHRSGLFDRLWIQPASGDAGGALGAALAVGYQQCGWARAVDGERDGMSGAYLGPEWPQAEIERRLSAAGARFTVLDETAMLAAAAQALAEGKAVGWMQGRMEFGPRALGARSILADPRSPTMQRMLNLKVKFRESFRPFAPAVRREEVSEWFALDDSSPYMLLVAPVAEQHRRAMTAEEQALFGIDKLNVPRSSIPAATHVDYSARIQTVQADSNPRFHALISAFKRLTGCGVLLNTSFNVRGEPIVCTPEDAFRCFMGSEIEVLVAGDCLLRKEDQNPDLTLDYKTAFAPD